MAITPKVIDVLTKAEREVLTKPEPGLDSGFPRRVHGQRGQDRPSAAAVADAALILLTVRVPETCRFGEEGRGSSLDSPRTRSAIPSWLHYAQVGGTLFSLELVPRITRAQSMDVLSSMASIAGYKAVLLAANALPRLFPMMSTAAGTVPPARVLVIGAGVAG